MTKPRSNSSTTGKAHVPSGKKGQGGARPGAGRPKGSKNDLTLKIAREAAVEGISPLQMMIKSMREFDARADELATLILAAVEARELEAAEKLMGRWFACRREAGEMASKAAPFVHPRLAALVTRDGDDVPLIEQAPVFNVTVKTVAKD